jgi:solute carrier family 25 carnitine/acylcarnitine transporter 20/29
MLSDFSVSLLFESGLPAVLVRDTPTFGVYFMVYDWVVEATANVMSGPDTATSLKSNQTLWTSQLVGGAAAGLSCWALALPMDVVKSVVQSAPLNQTSLSLASTAYAVYHRAGIAGFWAGAAPCLLRAVPTNAVTFFVFEYIKEFATRL